jgi:RNA polymerase sigma-70 factor (ECF subfamily)
VTFLSPHQSHHVLFSVAPRQKSRPAAIETMMRGATSTSVGQPDIDERHGLLHSLFDRWSSDVFGFVLARSGSWAVAQDVTSEVFLAAARAVGGDDPGQVTRSWLLTAARRRLIDQWRRQRTQRKIIERLSGERPTPAAVADADRERLGAALASLPEGQRLALTLRYLDEYSVAEVADELDTTYSAAESLLARARRSFERAWEEK